MKQNLDELPALVALAERCGADEIELNDLIVYNPELASQSIFDQRQQVEIAFQAAREQADQVGIQMFYGGVEEVDGVPACPFRSFTVTCDGTVGPCGPQRFAMGNIHDTPLRALWNSRDFVEMRESYAREELPEQCERCPSRSHREEDHSAPDTSYVAETLSARQWHNTDSRLQVIPSRSPTPALPPPCDAPRSSGGCSSTTSKGCA